MLEKLLKRILYYNIEEDFKDIYTKHEQNTKMRISQIDLLQQNIPFKSFQKFFKHLEDQ